MLPLKLSNAFQFQASRAIESKLCCRAFVNMSAKKSFSQEKTSDSSAAAEGAAKVDEIIWDEERHRFKTPDGKAYLRYAIKPLTHCSTTKQTEDEVDKQVMLMQHTFVPSVFRGQGVAAKLCVAAFQHCKDKGLLVLPVCTYISDTFLPRNPQWEDLVLKDSNTKSGL
ncbi:uncharacterized protein MPTK1_2g03010 [Marchantia polymorpha subsp. ruderalis]|uniref:N-acetyltransferase domain-containing protein n=1 Tax=Marchantia polymorpha TaxID=3197 RepID=A0A2R6WM85_MARPO|nr:hypothetical protein MARPO_0075s0062 [Marchantia polymorpha]BBN00904.1 hypothetical protein Mp_2g03010 [Marchantia polymorpha subsp. ruderalis]|eukprot:PTQ34958.1 hypothetical protein MARPO_0075s0062 [Marchantia polymorpha]